MDTDALMDGLTQAQDPPAGPPKWPSGAAKGIQKVSYTHDAMIDMLILDPTISQNDLAARFGYSACWVSQIISSDSFQAKLAERKDEIVDPSIRATIEDNFRTLVIRSMAILREKLDKPASMVPDNLALRGLEVGSRALGYGAKSSTVAVQVNMGDHLEKLAENLTGLLQRKKLEVLTGDDE